MNSSAPESETSPAWRVAVVGAGLSGLSAAHRVIELCRDVSLPLDLTVFESSDRIGGVIGTQRIGDYLVEMGADSFITDKPWAVDLCCRLGLEQQLIPTDATYRRSLVLSKGRPVRVPDGFTLLSPARIWPVLTTPILSISGKMRMGCEYFIPRRKGNDDESLASFVRRRFGRETLDRLVQPLVGGIYTSDPEKLSLRATLPRFLDMEQKWGSLIRAARRGSLRQSSGESGARYGLFVTLANGVSEIFDQLQRRIADAGTIRLQTPVTAIRREPQSSRWNVTLTDGSVESFDAVVTAGRAYQVADLLSSVDTPLADLLRGIQYASSAIVVSGHRLSDIRDPLDAFGLVIPAIEERKILAVSFSSRKFPGRAPDGRVLLRTFIGGAMQPELVDLSDEELFALARKELGDILGVDGAEDFMVVARYRNAMPQYHVGHLDRVDEIDRHVVAHEGLAIAGNAYRGVGIPDSIHSGEQAAERIFGTRPK